MWALGDILMATPMLNAIREAQPNAHISWIVDESHAEILACHPLIDEIIPLDSVKWRRLLRNWNIVAWTKRTCELHGMVAERRFDAVINCQPDKWWTLFLCVGKSTVGLYSSATLPFLSQLYTHAVPKPKNLTLHNTRHYLMATQAIGIPDASERMSIGQTAEEGPFLKEFRTTYGLSERTRLIILAPFTTAENRSLDIEFSASIAKWLSTLKGVAVVVTAGSRDSIKADRLAETYPEAGVVVAKGTTLRQYIALLREAVLVVTGDSSPMHIAAAVNTPFVALFGPTPVEERAPLVGVGEIIYKAIPCSPCDSGSCSNKIFKECLRGIELSDVKSAVTNILQPDFNNPN